MLYTYKSKKGKIINPSLRANTMSVAIQNLTTSLTLNEYSSTPGQIHSNIIDPGCLYNTIPPQKNTVPKPNHILRKHNCVDFSIKISIVTKLYI